MSKVRWISGAGALALAIGVVAYGFAQAGAAEIKAYPPSANVTSVGSGSMGAVKSSSAKTAEQSGRRARVLSGKRQVTIVRVGAFESGLSLPDRGRLTEVDDDRGRQLFVPTPLSRNQYLIKAYTGAGGKPVCWQVHNPQNTKPLTVRAARCDAGNPDQRFTITDQGRKKYTISNASAFLRYSSGSGLILEELGDAPRVSTFQLVDNGPAPKAVG
jgi:hypothetical protein